MAEKRIIAHGTYSLRGEETPFVVEFRPGRKSGLEEWARKALANGGSASKAGGALVFRFTKERLHGTQAE